MHPNRLQQTFMSIPRKRPRVHTPVLVNDPNTVSPDTLVEQPMKDNTQQTSTGNKNTSYMSIYL